ncbi:LOW QUALITY PROTEIN: corepressor interacting with RBPJ 1 [Drosophila tropicalis]|uniref:LOW QUALITY PROTEIN: corepressor interacting with RBPJ 1 n=1 Tax=Drosophila tropicalis TaxID=46794 RepID=UPI0035ABC997
MGKGFNNYMCKKFFHPASRDNLKRVWMAEQQAEAYKKKQEELRNQYEKEQNLHENKAMLSKDSKDKLSVNFMYEPPPGVRKEREKDDNEPEYKFEWQRKYNAPRESYCKGDTEIRDQPFGIQVRNVRCLKCHKWGHINTDKECSMYSISMSEARKLHAETEASDIMSKNVLEEQMKEDGLQMKRSALELQSIKVIQQQHQFVSSDAVEKEENPELVFLKSLSKSQKLKLLKKLEKIERIKRKGDERKSSKKKSKKQKEHKESIKKTKKKKSKKRSDESSSSSSSSSSSDSDSDDKHSRSNHRDRERRKRDRSRDNENNDRHRRDDKDSRRREEREDRKRRNDRSRSRDEKRRGSSEENRDRRERTQNNNNYRSRR